MQNHLTKRKEFQCVGFVMLNTQTSVVILRDEVCEIIGEASLVYVLIFLDISVSFL